MRLSRYLMDHWDNNAGTLDMEVVGLTGTEGGKHIDLNPLVGER